jgi:hypothetical protein
LPVLTPYYEAFYAGDRKIIPILKLTPLALAVWFMDDGSKSHHAVYFNTQQFDLESQQRMVHMLGAQLGLRGTLNRDKQYYRIRIAVDSIPRLRKLIEHLYYRKCAINCRRKYRGNNAATPA